MTYNVSTGGAYAVLYSVLALFTLLAVGSMGVFGAFLPERFNSFFVLGTQKDATTKTDDYFLSARNSAGAVVLGLSYFAGGMGAWVLYGTTEMGATPQLSWLGVIGYSSASAFPALLICVLGPIVRARSTDAFSTTDFGRQRYGRVMQVTISCVSGFFMFIFIVAELTSISSVFAVLTNNYSNGFGIAITASLGIVTIFYTTLAGLPASIMTDKFQGVMVAVLVLLLTIASTAAPENHVTRAEFDLASNWTVDGLMAAVTLVIAILCAELFNQSTWQRVWAAKSVPAMRRGFLLGSLLVFLLMMFFGVMGMIAYANDSTAYDNNEKYAYLAFFDLLEPLGNGWHVLVLVLVTALAASTLDSLQAGLTSIFSHDLVKVGWNPKWIARVFMVLINIPAVYIASKKFNVISLFLVADLVCATSVLPVFLGLQERDIGILKAPTELGAFLGCLSGVATVLVNGVVNNAEGGIFEYFWLRNGAMCSLCGSKTMVSFIITPIVSAIMTYVFSCVDVLVRGERARQPLIMLAFDDEKEELSESELEDGVNKEELVESVESGHEEEAEEK